MKTPVITLLWFLIIAAAFVADFNRAGFFIESFVIGEEAEVYAVCGDERVKLSDEDAESLFRTLIYENVYILCIERHDIKKRLFICFVTNTTPAAATSAHMMTE